MADKINDPENLNREPKSSEEEKKEKKDKEPRAILPEIPPIMPEVLNGLKRLDFMGAARAMMKNIVDYRELRMKYSCAIKRIQSKLEILDSEYETLYRRNPIKSVTARLKSTDSIINKLLRKGYGVSAENIEKYVNDIAGVRVVCPYIDDIYFLADALLKQDDVTLIRKKDYIQNPKENGYRSLHLIVSIPVYFSEKKENLKVEVQIRTIAMDFWASLEHQIKYKKDIPDQAEISKSLKECAEIISDTDEKMQNLRKKIDSAEDAPDEDEELFEQLRKFDLNI